MKVNENDIIQAISNKEYDLAIQQTEKYSDKKAINNDIFKSLVIGLINIKKGNVNEYMMNLINLNSFTKEELNNFYFIDTMNFLYDIMGQLMKDNVEMMKIIKLINREEFNFHLVYIIYLYSGIFLLGHINSNILSENINKKIIPVIQKYIQKERCSRCKICSLAEINTVQKINVIDDKFSKKKVRYKKKIGIRYNSISARKFINDNHIISYTKRNTDICTFQQYISYTLDNPSDKKVNNNISDCSKTLNCTKNQLNNKNTGISHSNSPNTNNVITLRSFSQNSNELLIGKIEKHLSNINNHIDILDKNFDDYEKITKNMKDFLEKMKCNLEC